jgi:hypothetical protein
MAYWSSFPAYSPIPGIGSVYGFFLTSLVYCTFSVLAMITALRIKNIRPREKELVQAEQSSRTVYPIITSATPATPTRYQATHK